MPRGQVLRQEGRAERRSDSQPGSRGRKEGRRAGCLCLGEAVAGAAAFLLCRQRWAEALSGTKCWRRGRSPVPALVLRDVHPHGTTGTGSLTCFPGNSDTCPRLPASPAVPRAARSCQHPWMGHWASSCLEPSVQGIAALQRSCTLMCIAELQDHRGLSGEGLDWMTSNGPSQPNPFHDSLWNSSRGSSC